MRVESQRTEGNTLKISAGDELERLLGKVMSGCSRSKNERTEGDLGCWKGKRTKAGGQSGEESRRGGSETQEGIELLVGEIPRRKERILAGRLTGDEPAIA